MKEHKDEGLIGNEKIEECIEMLQKQPSEEMLAVTLTTIRRRMQEGAKVVVSVDGTPGNNFQVQVLSLENGEQWLSAFTSFDEELKGSSPVMSTFMADLGELLKMALESEAVEGVILNPWNRTLMMDKDLIGLVVGKKLKSNVRN